MKDFRLLSLSSFLAWLELLFRIARIVTNASSGAPLPLPPRGKCTNIHAPAPSKGALPSVRIESHNELSVVFMFMFFFLSEEKKLSARRIVQKDFFLYYYWISQTLYRLSLGNSLVREAPRRAATYRQMPEPVIIFYINVIFRCLKITLYIVINFVLFLFMFFIVWK